MENASLFMELKNCENSLCHITDTFDGINSHSLHRSNGLKHVRDDTNELTSSGLAITGNVQSKEVSSVEYRDE